MVRLELWKVRTVIAIVHLRMVPKSNNLLSEKNLFSSLKKQKCLAICGVKAFEISATHSQASLVKDPTIRSSRKTIIKVFCSLQ